jgi:hypothetical protein
MSASESMATPTLPTSPSGQGVVGVVADLRGQVEGDAQAGLALAQQVAVALVGLLGRAEAGVLAHGPQRPRYMVAARRACRGTRRGSRGGSGICEAVKNAALRSGARSTLLR